MVSWLCKSAFFFVLCVVADRVIYTALSHGLATYYGLNKDAQVLCVGYSHTVLGIDANALERELDQPVAKYAMSGATIADRFQMIRHYLSLNPNVHTVIYDVDARLFDSDGISSKSYTLLLPFIDHPIMADYIRAKTTWEEYHINQLIKTTRFRDQTINQSVRGLINQIENEKRGILVKKYYKKYIERETHQGIQLSIKDLKNFYNTINYLSSKGIKIILIYIPVIDFLNNTDRHKYHDIIQLFHDIEEHNDNVIFLNYNPEYESQHNLFFDPQHLNYKGKRLITSRLANDLKKIMPE